MRPRRLKAAALRGSAVIASLTSSSAVVSWPRLKYAEASSMRTRARRDPSDSSEAVTRSFVSLADGPLPYGEELFFDVVVQPASTMAAASAAHAAARASSRVSQLMFSSPAGPSAGARRGRLVQLLVDGCGWARAWTGAPS